MEIGIEVKGRRLFRSETFELCSRRNINWEPQQKDRTSRHALRPGWKTEWAISPNKIPALPPANFSITSMTRGVAVRNVYLQEFKDDRAAKDQSTNEVEMARI
jgi:hypothetical protein